MTERPVFRNAEGVDLFDPAAVQRDACPVCGRRPNQRMRESDSLDAAWAEAEAALPEGAIFGLSRERGMYRALAALHPDDSFGGPVADHQGLGPTPAAALRTLAAKLRNPQEGWR